MQIKLTPFYLFLILLIVLVISMFVGKWFQEGFKEESENEPFVDFYRNNNQYGGNMVHIPQYSGSIASQKVMSLYDNLYFDIKNANLIEVQSTDTSANDTSSNSIQKIFVTPRAGTNTNVSPSNGIFNTSSMLNIASESLISKVTSNYSQFLYNTLTSIGADYNILYITWDTNTFLVIMDSNRNIIAIYLFNSSQLLSQIFANELSSVKSTTIDRPTNTNTNSNNGQVINSIYQITPYVKYNYSNGNIIIDNISYNRIDGSRSNSSSFQKAYNYNAWSASDGNGGIVVVLSYNNQSIVTILALDVDNSMTIVSTSRFNKNGIVINKASDAGTDINGPSNENTSGTTNTNENAGTNNTNKSSALCGDDLSCKWYWYFHTLVDNSYNSKTNDFFLKSQVVPPVCPTCPNCPSGGPCTNCGGNGGSGTMTTNGSSSGEGVGKGQKNYTQINADGTFVSTADPDTLGGGLTISSLGLNQPVTSLITSTKDVLNTGLNNATELGAGAEVLVGGAGAATYDLAKSGGKGATSLIRDTGSGTAGFIKDVGSGVGGFVKDSAGGIGGFVKDAASGTTGLLRDTASGTTGLLRDTASGIVNLGNRDSQGRYNEGSNVGYNEGSNVGYNQGSTVGSSRNMNRSNNRFLNSTSDKNQGYMDTSTPIDNYSYYGATQSKGAEYMPVTADFSAFRR